MKNNSVVKTKNPKFITYNIVLIFAFIFTILPTFVMIVNSFKTPNQMLDSVIWFSWPLHFENYKDSFSTVLPYIWNSITVSVVTTICITFIAALTGYAFGRYSFKGKKFLYTLIMMVMMVPSTLILVPTYLVTLRLGIYNTHFALLLPYCATSSIMAIFLVRGFVEELPKDIFEAATIDGMNDFQQFIHIGVPLLKPVLTTVSILSLMNAWNDFIWPYLVLDSENLKTIPIALYEEFNQMQGANNGAIFAGFIIVSLPLLIYFIFNLKKFMESLTSGAIK